jgi:hypothetical protein
VLVSQQAINQYLLIGLGISVGAVLFWYLFVKAPQQGRLMLKPWAEKRGLSFTPPAPVGWDTKGYEVTVLQGVVHGTQLLLRSSDLVNSRRAGFRGSTEVTCRSIAPVAASFSLILEPGPSRPAPDAVLAGDRVYDANVWTRSDNPAAARAWLAMPELRAALPGVVSDSSPVMMRYAGGEIAIQLPKPIWNEQQLERVLTLAAASAHARLG